MKTNDKYVSDFDHTQPFAFGFFLGFVNFYSRTMTKMMPIGDFQWGEKSWQKVLTYKEILTQVDSI